MNDFDLSIQEGKVMAGSTDIPMLIVGEQRDLWFRGNNLTAFLEYVQPRVALTKILKTRNTKTFAELLPRHISIPDILNMQGQVARCFAETCFQKFVSDNLQCLSGLSEADLIKEFAGLKLNLRQGFVSTGMGDLQGKLLTVAEAKKREADIELQSRKQQKLLQAEQPRTSECLNI